jgi:hypothetical protein
MPERCGSFHSLPRPFSAQWILHVGELKLAPKLIVAIKQFQFDKMVAQPGYREELDAISF